MLALKTVSSAVALSACLLASACTSTTAVKAESNERLLPEQTVHFVRTVQLGTKVYINAAGRVVRFQPARHVAAPGVELPPSNTPLEYVKYNASGEVIDWKLATLPEEPS